MKDFVRENLERKITKIRENENIYKEIDFNTDIDKEKPGYYIVDNETGELDFIYSESKSLLDEGVFSIDEYKFVRPDELVFNTSEKNFKPDGGYYSIYLMKHRLKNNEIIKLNFLNEFYDENASVWILLLDRLNFIQLNNLFDSGKDASVFIESIISKKHTHIIGCTRKNNMSITYKNSKNIFNTYLLDFRKQVIYICDKEYSFENKFIIENLKYLVAVYCSPEITKSITIKKDDLLVCKKDGTIYLKPFKVDKNIKFKMISQGNIVVQLYSLNTDSWIDINESNCIHCNNKEIYLRLKMDSYAKIMRIFIIAK